ncbi:hypothetical protein HK100_002482, partial [Physocladia obscura]
MADSNKFAVRSAKHFALQLALAHLEGLGINKDTRLSDLAARLENEVTEAEVQTAYFLSNHNDEHNEDSDRGNSDRNDGGDAHHPGLNGLTLTALVEAHLAQQQFSLGKPESAVNSSVSAAWLPLSIRQARVSVLSETMSEPSVESVTNARKLPAAVLALALSLSAPGFIETSTAFAFLLSSHADKTLVRRSLSAKNSTPTSTMTTLQSPALSIAIHPKDSTVAAVALMDGSIHIFDAQTLTPMQSFVKVHAKYASCIAFSNSGAWLASAGYDWKLHCFAASFPQTPEGLYTLTHTFSFLGAIESIVFLPPTSIPQLPPSATTTAFDFETLTVASRNDSRLHFIALPPSKSHSNGNAVTEEVAAEPLRFFASMNSNLDDWVSFTPMSLSIAADISTAESNISDSWTVAIYTDLPSGRICLYRLSTIVKPDETKIAKAAESVVESTIASLSLNSTSAKQNQTLHEFKLSHIGDAFGTVADAFSRPRCVLFPHQKTRTLILAATSDDSKVFLYDVSSCTTSVEAACERVGVLDGFGGIVRTLVCWKYSEESE